MRASILVLGPLLARKRRAVVSLPGGCAIGTRPIDLHLFGMRKLGADIYINNGYVVAEAKHGLVGNLIKLPFIFSLYFLLPIVGKVIRLSNLPQL